MWRLPIRKKDPVFVADSSSIPRDPPTIPCQNLIAAVPQMSLPELLCYHPTAYSLPSLRPLWSAVMKSPIFQLWARLYQHVFCKKPLLFFVLKQMSQCRSFAKWVQILCFPGPSTISARDSPLVIHEKSCESIDVIEHSYPPDCPWNPVAILANLAIVHVVILRRLLDLCVQFLLVYASTSFCCWIFLAGHSILWWRCWRSKWRWSGGIRWKTRDNEWHVVRHVAIDSVAMFGEMWFLTTGPVVGIPMIFAELPKWKSCGCFLQEASLQWRSPILWHVQWLLLLFAPRRWPSSPSWDSSTSSWSPIRQSWGLLTICTQAPQSTTNSLSSSSFVDAAGNTLSSEGELSVALSFSLSLWMFLAKFHALLRAHRCCLSVSSWDRSSNFTALGLRWLEILTCNF